jgi:hypothetical protein
MGQTQSDEGAEDSGFGEDHRPVLMCHDHGGIRMSTTKLQNYFAPMKRGLPRAIWQPVRAFATGIITPIRFSQCTGHWKSSSKRAQGADAGGCLQIDKGAVRIWAGKVAHVLPPIHSDVSYRPRLAAGHTEGRTSWGFYSELPSVRRGFRHAIGKYGPQPGRKLA